MISPEDAPLPLITAENFSAETAAESIVTLDERLGHNHPTSAAYIREIGATFIELGHLQPQQESAGFFGHHAGQIIQAVKAKIPHVNAGALVEHLLIGYEEVAGQQEPDWRMWAVFTAMPHETDLSLTMQRARTGYDRNRKRDIIISTHAVKRGVGRTAVEGKPSETA